MKNLKQQLYIMTLSALLLIGCASTPMKELKPSEMIPSYQNKYEQMPSSQNLTGWEKGIWEYYHKHYKLGVKLLDPYKDKDISRVANAYAFMYQEGVGGLKRDLKKAVKYYNRAIKIDNYPPALYNLSFLYNRGIGVSRDKNKYFELLQKSAKLGTV